MELYKFEWLIKEKRLYMPQTDKLGDSLEGTTSQGEKQLLNKIFQEVRKDQQPAIAKNNNRIEQFAQAFRNTYFVICWHMNEEKFPSKWNDFLPHLTEGVAIRSTFQKLCNSVPGGVYTGMVNYMNYETDPLRRRDGMLYPNFFEYIISKDQNKCGWEQEVRSVASLPTIKQEDSTNLFQCCSDNSLVYAPNINLEELIVSIHLHPKSNENHINSVRELLKQEKLEHLLET